jgi:hypothetical protein
LLRNEENGMRGVWHVGAKGEEGGGTTVPRRGPSAAGSGTEATDTGGGRQLVEQGRWRYAGQLLVRLPRAQNEQ